MCKLFQIINMVTMFRALSSIYQSKNAMTLVLQCLIPHTTFNLKRYSSALWIGWTTTFQTEIEQESWEKHIFSYKTADIPVHKVYPKITYIPNEDSTLPSYYLYPILLTFIIKLSATMFFRPFTTSERTTKTVKTARILQLQQNPEHTEYVILSLLIQLAAILFYVVHE